MVPDDDWMSVELSEEDDDDDHREDGVKHQVLLTNGLEKLLDYLSATLFRGHD